VAGVEQAPLVGDERALGEQHVEVLVDLGLEPRRDGADDLDAPTPHVGAAQGETPFQQRVALGLELGLLVDVVQMVDREPVVLAHGIDRSPARIIDLKREDRRGCVFIRLPEHIILAQLGFESLDKLGLGVIAGVYCAHCLPARSNTDESYLRLLQF
jgi:hypothetical protein